MLALFGQGAWLGVSAAAQPGPFQAYVLAQSLRNGPRRSLGLAFVPMLSDPPVIAVVLAVLGQVPDGFVRWLSLVGGAVLLWVGVGALRGALGPPVVAEARAAAPPRGLWRATLVNFTNPNAWIFWSLIGGPLLTTAWRTSPTRALAFLCGFYVCLTLGNLALVVLAGRAAAAGPRLARVLGVASGLALLAFGLWQLARALP